MKVTTKLLLLGYIFLSLEGCAVNQDLDRNISLSQGTDITEDSISKAANIEYLRPKLEQQFVLVSNGCLTYEALLYNYECLPRVALNPAVIIAAAIYEMPELDNVVILFFSKAYYNNIVGLSEFKNVSCCYSDNTILLLYFEHFLRISKNNPLGGWFTIDIYNWAITQNRFWQNDDIKKVFEQIQEELEKQKEK